MSSPTMIIQKSTCDLLQVDRLPQTGVRMPYGTPREKTDHYFAGRFKQKHHCGNQNTGHNSTRLVVQS